MKQWLDSAIERGAVPVLTGSNGDMDTIGSAIALSSIHPSLLRVDFIRRSCKANG